MLFGKPNYRVTSSTVLIRLSQTTLTVAARTADFRFGSKRVLTTPKRHFRFAPINGHHQTGPVGPVRATNGSDPVPGVSRTMIV